MSAGSVLLGYMPLGVIQLPSLGLSLLKGGLQRRRVPCDIRYFNLELLDRFFEGNGRERGRMYVRVTERYQLAFAGEALFAERRFGSDPARRDYIARAAHAAGSDEQRWLAHLDRVIDPFLDHCLESVDWDRYRVLGFSSVFLGMTVPSALLARRVKECHPHVVTVLGGPNTEGEMGIALAECFPEFDYVLRGEADESFPVLVEAILNGNVPGPLDGLVRRNPATGVTESWPAQRVETMDALPIPVFDDFIQTVRSSAMAARYREHLELPFESSRGCWWGEASHCKFCGINALGMNFRSKSEQRLGAELDSLVERYDPALLAASDAILDRHYFKSVLPSIGQKGYRARISYEVKANLKREDVAALAAAGVSEILPGIETFSTRILKLVGKGATIFDNVLCLRLAEEHGLKVRWYHMCGLPGETLEDYAADVEAIERIPHLQPPREIARFTLQRFTPYFNNATANGIRGVRPLPEYRVAFPFGQEVLERLAYHFDFVFDDGRPADLTATIEAILQSTIVRWQERYGGTVLDIVDRGNGAFVVDTRRDTPRVFVLDAAGRTVYRLLDRPQTLEAILRSAEFRACLEGIDLLAGLLGGTARHDGELLDEARREAEALGAPILAIGMPLLGLTPDVADEVRQFMEQLDRAGLVIAETGRYLGIAVPRPRTSAPAASRTVSRTLTYERSFDKALRALRETLEETDYAALAAQLTGGAGVHDLRRAIRRLRFLSRPRNADSRAWVLISLFLLGQPVRDSRVREVLGDSLDELFDLGLIAADPPWIRCERYAVVPVQGRLFVVSRLPQERSAPESVAIYVGLDTGELIDHAAARRVTSLLDLGCGGGLVGISTLLSDAACRVVGVDVCAEAVQAARVNAALNGVEYDAREGDLYAPVAGERFDLIVADPPALALPDDLAFPVYGTGGPEGDRLFRRIVEGAPAHLTPGGRLVAITELQCATGRIPFLDWSRHWLAGTDGCAMRVQIRGARHLAASYHASLGRALTYLPGGALTGRHHDAAARLVEFAAESRLGMGYWVHVEVEAVRGPSRLSIEWKIPRATAQSRPRLAVESSKVDERVQAIYGQPLAGFDAAFGQLLARLNGTDTIGDIARGVAQYREDPGQVAYLTEYFTELATALTQAGLIELESAEMEPAT